MVARKAWGWGHSREGLPMSTDFFWGDEIFLEINSGGDCTTLVKAE